MFRYNSLICEGMSFNIYKLEFIYANMSRLDSRDGRLKMEVLGLVSKIINFGCSVLINAWSQTALSPLAVRVNKVS